MSVFISMSKFKQCLEVDVEDVRMMTHRCVEWRRCAVKMLCVIPGCRGRRRAAATREKVYWHQWTGGAVCQVTWCPVLELNVVLTRWSHRWIWCRSTATREKVNREWRRYDIPLFGRRCRLVDVEDVAWCLSLTGDDGQIDDFGCLVDVVFLDGLTNRSWSKRCSTKTWSTVLKPDLKNEWNREKKTSVKMFIHCLL